MTRMPGGLSAPEVSSLLLRALDGEPGVFERRHPAGTVHLARGRLGGLARGPFVFAIATEGGVLLRPSPDEVHDLVRQPNLVANHALPAWVLTIVSELCAPQPKAAADAHAAVEALSVEKVLGAPDQWVWVPLKDETDFLRRRPLLLDALGHARHQLEAVRDTQGRLDVLPRGRPGSQGLQGQ